MKRVSLVVSLAWIAIAAAESQPPRPPIQPARPAVIQPGTYQTTGFVTRFDPKGTWTTTADGASVSGRYSIDNDTITFRTSPPTCENERVTYRIVPEPEGFRLELISDSCLRKPASYRYVAVRATRSS
jgi:hypothetical protein